MARSAASKWLAKAKDDLNWTQANIREKIWYGACFTAQQSAEKSLKAYLISKRKRVVKIHDLGALVEMAKKFDPSFEELRPKAIVLTDYYAPARYPDIAEFMKFSKEKAIEAYSLAEIVVGFIEKRL